MSTKISHAIFLLGTTVIFLFIFMQVYAVFVDHYKEYPWEQEKFLLWELHQPSPAFHLSMFGFPYYRNWDGIGEYIMTENPRVACPKDGISNCSQPNSKTKYYSTNERSSISRYHIEYPKDTNSAGFFVQIINPQSFTNEIIYEKASYWAEDYVPVFTIERCMLDTISRLYFSLTSDSDDACYSQVKTSVKVFYMPVGNLDQIKVQGY